MKEGNISIKIEAGCVSVFSSLLLNGRFMLQRDTFFLSLHVGSQLLLPEPRRPLSEGQFQPHIEAPHVMPTPFTH